MYYVNYMFTEAAKLAVSDAGIYTMKLVKQVDITTNYNDSGKVQYLLASSDAEVSGTDYAEDVRFHVYVPASDYGRIEKQITEVTSARAVIEVLGETYI